MTDKITQEPYVSPERELLGMGPETPAERAADRRVLGLPDALVRYLGKRLNRWSLSMVFGVLFAAGATALTHSVIAAASQSAQLAAIAVPYMAICFLVLAFWGVATAARILQAMYEWNIEDIAHFAESRYRKG